MSECVTSATLSRPSRVKSIWLINISAIVIWPSPSVACQTHTHTHDVEELEATQRQHARCKIQYVRKLLQ